MKRMTVRKLVVCIIGLVMAELFALSLLGNVVLISTASGSQVNGVGTTGLQALGFSLSTEMAKFLNTYFYPSVITGFGAGFGLMSWACLIIAVVGTICIAINFGKREKQNYAKVCIGFSITMLVLLVVYAVVALIAVGYWTYGIVYTNGVDGLIFSTDIITFIVLQVACLIALIICSKKVPDRELGKKEKSVVLKDRFEENMEENLFTKIIEEEKEIISAIKAYNGLRGDFITDQEYFQKKARLLTYSSEKIKKIAVEYMAVKVFGVMEAENKIVGIIKEYKKLCDAELISIQEYLEKKNELLSLLV